MLRQDRAKGNTAAEYGVIAAVVLVGCLAMIWALGGNLQTHLSGLQGDMEASTRAALVSKLQNAGGTMTITQEDGSTITLSRDSLGGENGQTTTSGALGNDRALGSGMMLNGVDFSNARITPQQAGLLIKMANQAHYLAYIADAIERLAVQSRGDQMAFRNLTINFNGRQQRARELSNLISYDQEALSTFRELQKELTGTQMDPAVRDYVFSLTRQVETSILTTRNTAKEALYRETNPMEVARLESALTSHAAGGAICDTSGSGKNQDKKCEDGRESGRSQNDRDDDDDDDDEDDD